MSHDEGDGPSHSDQLGPPPAPDASPGSDYLTGREETEWTRFARALGRSSPEPADPAPVDDHPFRRDPIPLFDDEYAAIYGDRSPGLPTPMDDDDALPYDPRTLGTPAPAEPEPNRPSGRLPLPMDDMDDDDLPPILRHRQPPHPEGRTRLHRHDDHPPVTYDNDPSPFDDDDDLDTPTHLRRGRRQGRPDGAAGSASVADINDVYRVFHERYGRDPDPFERDELRRYSDPSRMIERIEGGMFDPLPPAPDAEPAPATGDDPDNEYVVPAAPDAASPARESRWDRWTRPFRGSPRTPAPAAATPPAPTPDIPTEDAVREAYRDRFGEDPSSLAMSLFREDPAGFMAQLEAGDLDPRPPGTRLLDPEPADATDPTPTPDADIDNDDAATDAEPEDTLRVAGDEFIVDMDAREARRAEARKNRLDARTARFFRTGVGPTLLKMIPLSNPMGWPKDLSTSWKSKLGEVLLGAAISQGSKYAVRAGLWATGFEGWALTAALAGGAVAESVKEGRKIYQEQDESLAARDKLKGLMRNKTRLGRAAVRGALYSALGYYGAQYLAEYAPDVVNPLIESVREKAGSIKDALIGSLSLGDPAPLPWETGVDAPVVDAPAVDVDPTQVPAPAVEVPSATGTPTATSTEAATATATATATQESATATPTAVPPTATAVPPTATPVATSAPAIQPAPAGLPAPEDALGRLPTNDVPGFTQGFRPPPPNPFDTDSFPPATVPAPSGPIEVLQPVPNPVDAAPIPNPLDGAPIPNPVDTAPIPNPVDGSPIPGSVDVDPVVDPVVTVNPALSEINLDQFSTEVQDALKNVPDHYTLPEGSGEGPWSAARHLLEESNPDVEFTDTDVMKVAAELCRENDISYAAAGVVGTKDAANLFGENAKLNIDEKVLSVIGDVLQSK